MCFFFCILFRCFLSTPQKRGSPIFESGFFYKNRDFLKCPFLGLFYVAALIFILQSDIEIDLTKLIKILVDIFNTVQGKFHLFLKIMDVYCESNYSSAPMWAI